MYARKFYRRRARKYLRKRGVTSKRVSKSVKTYVKRQIHRNIENKMVSTGASFAVVSARESAYYPSAQPLLPPVSLGSGPRSRIGNSIMCVNGKCRVMFSLKPYNVTTNYLPDPVWVKVWFIRTLATAFQGTNLSNTFLDNFFRETAGSTGFRGDQYDMLNDVNTDSMRVLAVRQFKLGASYAPTNGNIGTNGYFDNSPSSKIISVNWRKWTKKQLKFDNDIANDYVINDNIYMVCQVIHSTGQYNPADYPVQCTYVSDMLYEDA